MDPATAGLIGAAIGGGVALLKSAVDGWNTRRLEAAKAEWTQEHAVETELRAHVASVAKDLLACQHSMEWICSLTDGGAELTPQNVAGYHAEIHEGFPNLLGGLATVSSLNDRVYRELSELADKIFAIDSAIAAALQGYDQSPARASAEVAKQRKAATDLYKALPQSIGEIMKGVA